MLRHCDDLNFAKFGQGKKLFFVTNNSTKSRKQYAKKFSTLGLEVSEVMLYSTTFPREESSRAIELYGNLRLAPEL